MAITNCTKCDYWVEDRFLGEAVALRLMNLHHANNHDGPGLHVVDTRRAEAMTFFGANRADLIANVREWLIEQEASGS